jgi:hypothetical protein
MRRLVLAALGAALLATAPAAAAQSTPELLGRAILPSDAYQPGPPSGAALTGDLNGVVAPFPGQPIPGFSAVLNAGRGEFLAMPDNGYGSKGNSADFLLRLYRIRPDFRRGDVDVLGHIGLSDPGRHIPFALTRSDRALTGADFDLESVRRASDGTFWFGEEFGPFLLHTDERGRVLEAPIELPGVRSPQNPYLPSPDAWNLPASRGFEGMAISKYGRYLYPVLEGALRGDPDPRRRVIHEFDTRNRRYTGRTWTYRTDPAFPNAVIGDFTAVDAHRFVAIERDDAQGAEARQKKIYLVDLRRTDASGALEKRLVLDLLRIPDPAGVSLPARPGEYGVGRLFRFPLQSVESLEVLGGDRLLIANDNNYPFSDGRWTARDRPDDTELIVVRAPALRRQGQAPAFDRGANPTTLAVIGDTPYGPEQVTRLPVLIARINAEPKVRTVVHVGDIKNGSTVCSDAYFSFIRGAFETFEDPVVYTPGDNEWTDCHRANNGGYLPTERLAALRRTFFSGDRPGRRELRQETQADEGFPENALWTESRVVFATIHAVGSNNGLAPWFGAAETPAQREERLAEVAARTAAGLSWIDVAFDRAEASGAAGVALFMQADTYTGSAAQQPGFDAIRARIAHRAAAFGRPVLLVQGDSHRYLVDTPIAAAPNLTRVVVEGETVDEHLLLHVDPRAAGVFSWTRVRATP